MKKKGLTAHTKVGSAPIYHLPEINAVCNNDLIMHLSWKNSKIFQLNLTRYTLRGLTSNLIEVTMIHTLEK